MRDRRLFDAILANDLVLISMLLSQNVDIRTAFIHGVEEIRPLSLAAQIGSLEIVKILVEEGANVDSTNEWGSTALFYALEANHFDIADYLLEEGADIDVSAGSCPPIIASVVSCNLNVTRYLVEHGANVNERDATGRDALDYAKLKGEDDTIAYLANIT